MRSAKSRTLATPTAFGKNANIGASFGESPAKTKRSRSRVEIDAERFGQQRARHRQLVVRAEPAVDVDRAHLRRHPLGLHQRDDAIDRRRAAAAARPRRSRSRGRPRDRAGRTRARSPAPRAGCARRSRRAARDSRARVASSATKRLTQPARCRVVAHVERAVLADHRVDRPHARDVIAPARRPAGDRDHELAGGVQPLERRVGAAR